MAGIRDHDDRIPHLLEAGVALETISGIMGHISPETTRIYTKVDLAALRSAALDLEEVHHG
jgi:site-specific recombinase XerD